jgi:hypothetical protein
MDKLKKYLDGSAMFDPDELTPVTTLGTMGDKVNSLVALCVHMHTEQRHLSTNVRLLDDAVRAGHACVQADTIKTIERLARAQTEAGIRQDERLQDLEESAKDERDMRWRLVGLAFGLTVSLLGTVGGGLWWLRGMQGDVSQAAASVASLERDHVVLRDDVRRELTKATSLTEQLAESLNMLAGTVDQLRNDVISTRDATSRQRRER